jgi:hypothetical protein
MLMCTIFNLTEAMLVAVGLEEGEGTIPLEGRLLVAINHGYAPDKAYRSKTEDEIHRRWMQLVASKVCFIKYRQGNYRCRAAAVGGLIRVN